MSNASSKVANGFADLMAASIVASQRGGAEALQMVDVAVGRLASALDDWAELHILVDDEPKTETGITDPVTGTVVVTYHCGHVHGLANGDQMLGALCPTCKGALDAAEGAETAGEPWLSSFNEDPPPDGEMYDDGMTFITGTGQILRGVHAASRCAGRPCVIHNPSDHRMRGWPTNFRTGGLFDIKPAHMERMCEHGTGHPDPDDAAFWASRGVDVGVHGCDGCCGARTEDVPVSPGVSERVADGRTLAPRPGDAVYEEQLKALPAVGSLIEDSRDIAWRVHDYDVGMDSIVLRSMQTGNDVKYRRSLFLELWDLGAFHEYDDFGR